MPNVLACGERQVTSKDYAVLFSLFLVGFDTDVTACLLPSACLLQSSFSGLLGGTGRGWAGLGGGDLRTALLCSALLAGARGPHSGLGCQSDAPVSRAWSWREFDKVTSPLPAAHWLGCQSDARRLSKRLGRT